MTEAELHEILSALEYGGDELQLQARARLDAAGDDAIEPLVQTLEQFLRSHDVDTYEKYRQQLLEKAFLLADYGSPLSLRVLAKVALRREAGGNQAPFLNVVAALEARASEEDVRALVSLLGWFRAQTGDEPLERVVATALLAIAESHPERHSELRAALPVLNRMGRFTLLRLRRKLRATLSTRSLPLPAQAPQGTANLPRPTEEWKP